VTDGLIEMVVISFLEKVRIFARADVARHALSLMADLGLMDTN